jgi:Flp pilus assembly protein TadG
VNRPARAVRVNGERGSAAAEFALVLPALVLFVFGVVETCAAVFANASLHYATESASRYVAIQSNQCACTVASSSVQSYGAGRYQGPSLTSLTFTSSAGACGTGTSYKVTGIGSFTLRSGLFNLTLPLSATACYPAVT